MGLKTTLRTILPSCFKAKETPRELKIRVSEQYSSKRLSLSDLSNPDSSLSVSDISNSVIGTNLHVFTLQELKLITQNFSSSNYLGEGGFGPVHKGFIHDNIRPGLEAQPVAVKLLDLDGTQGHMEWLAEVIFLGQLKHPHLVKLIGYCCEDKHRLLVYEYMARGNLENQLYRSTSRPYLTNNLACHLTTLSDVYSFGVVLLELLTGRRVVDKSRPNREKMLVEWARPLLRDPQKLDRIIDPRLDGQYSREGAKKAAALAYQCLSHHSKFRPRMSNAVKTLEPLLDMDDIPVGPFVYIVRTEGENEKGEGKKAENNNKNENEGKELKREKKAQGLPRRPKGHRHRHRLSSSYSRAVYSDTALYRTINSDLDSPMI
ncbi:hypothetical protein RHMOL_Rhmol08G0316200 [Rhododendron molle]|uniref:Uncharacterized protein n=1 Tax=Rhododendron molle TaxID=49168 RepID=A0ACC0MWP0_RHOML|nr:hypothetical protein RHMOL_Rhmol08G0316200 [Rhododendron molle]